MYTHLFITVPLALCALALVVAAIRTHSADQREKAVHIYDAYAIAMEYVTYRFQNGWYYNAHDPEIEKDFHKKYNELISQ